MSAVILLDISINQVSDKKHTMIPLSCSNDSTSSALLFKDLVFHVQQTKPFFLQAFSGEKEASFLTDRT